MMENKTRKIDPILLDTSFFITLMNETRPHHDTAVDYFDLWVKSGITLYVSTIVLAEFSVKESITDVVKRQLRILPFDYDHAFEAARLFRVWLNLDKSAKPNRSRDTIKDDIKLFAQANVSGAVFLATDDQGMERIVGMLQPKRKTLKFKILPLWNPFVL